MGEHLVLGGQGRGRVLVDHHPGLHPGRRREERRQTAVESSVKQERDPALGDRAELGERQLGEVERQGDRLAVEVATADHASPAGRHGIDVGHAATGEDERVVRRRVEFDVEHAPEVVEGIADRPMDLRHAAQRVGILDLVGTDVMGTLEAAAPQEVAHLGRDLDLARVRSGQLVGGRERDVRAQQGFDRQGGGDACRSDESVGIRQQQGTDGGHHLGPVEQGEPFLGLQGQRFQAGLAQGDQARDDLAVELHPAPADERQGEMRERGQVAGRTHAPLLRNERMDPKAQEVEQPVHDDRPTTAVTERQRIRPQQQHRAHDFPGEGRSHARRVAHQEVLLEPSGVGRRDERGGEIAEPGGDPVDDGALGEQAVDHLARLDDPFARVDIELGDHAGPRHRLDFGDGQVRAGQDDRPRVTGGPRIRVRVAVRDLRLGHWVEDSGHMGDPCSVGVWALDAHPPDQARRIRQLLATARSRSCRPANQAMNVTNVNAIDPSTRTIASA